MLKELFTIHNCDKGVVGANAHYYHDMYEDDMFDFIDDPVNLLEVGVLYGSSLKCWLKYFKAANIYTIDHFERIKLSEIDVLRNPRVKYIVGDSTLPSINEFIDELWDGVQFDFIIDDGSHLPEDQEDTFNNLIQYLSKDGIYYIEDVEPVHLLNQKQLDDRWDREEQEVQKRKMSSLLSSIYKYNVEEVDLRKKAGQSNSFVFKITK